MIREYLVTGQAYEKKDQYKQTILLHDVFMAKDENDAKELFNLKFDNDYKILRVYSAEEIAAS